MKEWESHLSTVSLPGDGGRAAGKCFGSMIKWNSKILAVYKMIVKTLRETKQSFLQMSSFYFFFPTSKYSLSDSQPIFIIVMSSCDQTLFVAS